MVSPSPILKESTGTMVLSLPLNVANLRFVIISLPSEKLLKTKGHGKFHGPRN
jgi:hypothetical protein